MCWKKFSFPSWGEMSLPQQVMIISLCVYTHTHTHICAYRTIYAGGVRYDRGSCVGVVGFLS